MSTYREMPAAAFPPERVSQTTSTFLNAAYGWMCVGLLITATTSFLMAGSVTLMKAVLTNGPVFWIVAFAQLGIVFFLSARVQEMTATTAAVLFILYAALTGVTLSFVLLAYTGESIATTFIVSGGSFGALAIYGSTTKRDLTGVGQVMFMGLVGVILASIVGIFWHSDALQFVLSLVGVVVFAGLTAYDAQRLVTLSRQTPTDRVASYAIVGALALYLDFMNLFLFLLRFTGTRRED